MKYRFRKMGKVLFAVIITLLLSAFSVVTAQVPQGIPYQAVARDGAGQPLDNQAVKVRFSILDSIATGSVVYAEIHTVTTSQLGLFTANVGMGTVVTGNFSNINWGQNFKFLKVELDTTGAGNAYVVLGTQQMMSVPYALYSGLVAGNVGIGTNQSLSCFASITLNGGSYVVPIGESWKIVSLNISPQWGAVTVSIPFFEPVINGCRYAFQPTQTYQLLNINGIQYNTSYPYTYPGSGTFYQISQNCGGSVCQSCPPSQSISFTPSSTILSSIKLPIWINEGQTLHFATNVILSIEKYH